MGDFARQKIQEVIDILNKKINGNAYDTNGYWTQEKLREFKNVIGEPLIRDSLNELYQKAFLTTESEIDKEIDHLRKMKGEM